MSTIVGIDPSLTSCGIAVVRSETRFHIPSDGYVPMTYIAGLLSVGHPGKDSASWDDRSDRIVSQTRHVLTKIPRAAELVVMEDLPSHVKLLPSFRDRCVLWGGLYSALRARNTPIAVCNPKTRAKWATGSGSADKKLVLACVREQWPNNRIHNDDCADALTMASMGALKLGWTLPFEIKDRHHLGLDVVAWPKEIAA
ncbi:hypothetical protein [Williamsia soli]|uniref:hypothetical protein n=1 Tax=Williamsia soli TaxID=364929 RepID=UPI001A9EA82E|nr:hypothetical protein [Williamsia soli]